MNTKTREFLKELRELLIKYDAEIYSHLEYSPMGVIIEGRSKSVSDNGFITVENIDNKLIN